MKKYSENWAQSQLNKENRITASRMLKKIKKDEKGKKFKYVPHPTSPKCFIRVEIKD